MIESYNDRHNILSGLIGPYKSRVCGWSDPDFRNGYWAKFQSPDWICNVGIVEQEIVMEFHYVHDTCYKPVRRFDLGDPDLKTKICERLHAYFS